MSVMNILNTIYNEKLKQNIHDIDIAKACNVSKGSVSLYFSGNIRIPFLIFVKLVELVYKENIDKQKQLINSFCNATDRPENLRLAMEYANANHEQELLNLLVKKEEDSHNKKNIEWSSIYELLYLRRNRTLSSTDYKDLLIERTKKSLGKEMKVLSKLAMMYLYLDLNEFNSLLKLTGGIFEEIKTIKNDYIRESYNLRATEMVVIANFMRNNLSETRKYAESALEKDYLQNYPLFIASIYNWLGQSYILDNPPKSIKLVEQAIEILETKNEVRYKKYIDLLMNTLDFIKIYWNIDLDNLVPRSISELSHLLCKRGEKKEAINIFNQIRQEKGKLSNFEKYYYSICTNDEQLKNEALDDFEREGKTFYANLLKHEKFL